MSALEEIGRAVATAADRVGPAVVGLGRGWGRGSGVVIAQDTVLASAHVLRGDEVAVRVGGAEDSAHGKVAGIDADLDLAVVRVQTGDVAPVAWDPERIGGVTVGTPVFALADPGGRGLRTSVGFVTATNRSFRGPGGRRIRGTLEHSAPMPRGASGGPLVDTEGFLLGLNAIRLEGGLILAVPADPAAQRRVGLPERDGLLVRGVDADSPAGRAGLERGDLLVAAAGAALDGVDALFDALEAAAGGALELTVLRGLEEREVTVSFA